MIEENRFAFTLDALDALPPANDAGYIVWDAAYTNRGRLGARVGKTKVAFINQFRVNGKLVKKTVCALDTLRKRSGTPTAKIKWLRAEADAVVGAVSEKGKTPAEEKAAGVPQKVAREQWSIRELGDAFLAMKKVRAPYADGGKNAELAIKCAAEKWGDTPVVDLTPADAKTLIAGLAKARGNEQAIKMLSVLKTVLKYGENELEIRGVRASIFGGVIGSKQKGGLVKRNRPRTQVMSVEERDRFEAALDSFAGATPDNRDVADCLRLILSTGARQGEWIKAQWHHIDWDARTWTRPAANRKMRDDHVQPLGPKHLEILEGLKQRQKADGRYQLDGEGYIFPGAPGSQLPHRGRIDGPFKKVLKLADIEDKGLCLHDLRATAITHWLYETGLSFTEVGNLIGSDPATLQKHYARLAKPIEEVAAKAYG